MLLVTVSALCNRLARRIFFVCVGWVLVRGFAHN